MSTARQARYHELTTRLHRCDHEYYVLARPTVSDREYDRLLDELLRLERDHPELRQPDSPSARVGSDLSAELPEVAHTVPVLSLDKAYAAAEVSAWMEKSSAAAGLPLSYTVEEKIDGAAIVLYYEAGRLARAVTRGNGIVGNDVTANVRTIRSVPLLLAEPVTVAARGEIFLLRADFARLNAAAEAAYANPRNFAAGAVRRVKSRDVAAIPLRFLAYEGVFPGAPPAGHAAAMDRLRALGLPVNPGNRLLAPAERLADARARHPAWNAAPPEALPEILQAAAAGRAALPYEIDGVVIKVNELAARAGLGVTGHHPRWARAFKFDAPQGETEVREISVQVGRTGRVTPVARVAPVAIGGTTVANVTLHNQDYVAALELAIGDRVAVSRRGDVIPAVERVLDKNERGNTTWRLPERCPACGSALRLSGAHHFCRNQRCPEQVRGRLRFFTARDQMDIDHLGSETLDRLIDGGLVTDVQDIFTFEVDRVLEWEGFGERKAALLKEGIRRSRGRPFRTVLPALGMPEIGPKVTELLIDAGYYDVDRLLAVAKARDPEPLTAIEGIGEKTAAAIIAQLTDPANLRRIAALRAAGLCFAAAPPKPREADAERGPFAGQSWCVTGSFSQLGPRARAKQKIAAGGGRVTDAVTSRTTHLLAGRNPGGKLAKAQRLGVTVVSEEEFLRLPEDAAAGDPVG